MRLEIKQLSKSFGSKKVLDQLDLCIDQPGIWALIAPNGAGKTTLLDCIANLQTADSGKIYINGKSHNATDIYQSFSYLQDNRVLYPELTGLEHLKLIQKIQRLPIERINQVIEEIGIQDYANSPVKSYSLGMKQHLLLALGIMNQPKLLLLDEPLNGLDPSSYIQTRQLLQKLAKNGSTIIVSSHQLNEVDQLTNQLLFLKNGKIIQHQLADIDRGYRIHTSDDQLVLQQLTSLEGLELSKGVLHIHTKYHSLQEFLEEIMTCPVEILQVDRLEHQSEEIYKELFE